MVPCRLLETRVSSPPLMPESSGAVFKCIAIQASPAEVWLPLDMNQTSQEVSTRRWLRLTWVN